MIDHCMNCRARGDMKACQAMECANHQNWYAVAKQFQIDQLRNALNRAISWAVTFASLALTIGSLALVKLYG